jgi:hypothetical protein
LIPTHKLQTMNHPRHKQIGKLGRFVRTTRTSPYPSHTHQPLIRHCTSPLPVLWKQRKMLHPNRGFIIVLGWVVEVRVQAPTPRIFYNNSAVWCILGILGVNHVDWAAYRQLRACLYISGDIIIMLW